MALEKLDIDYIDMMLLHHPEMAMLRLIRRWKSMLKMEKLNL